MTPFHESSTIWLKHLYIGDTSGASIMFYPYGFRFVGQCHACRYSIGIFAMTRPKKEWVGSILGRCIG
ncbi:hypothetical protein Hanom_Chr15g01388411 [Helianthus anomalus]